MLRYVSDVGKALSPVLCLLGFFHAGIAAQDVEILVVPETVAFEKDAMARDRLKRECNLEQSISRYIKQYAKDTYRNIVNEKPASGAYHVLTAKIIGAHGRGGGAWGGPKILTIKGQLTDQTGKVLGTFQARRYSGGGPFAFFKGTCGILGRCARALGRDVAYWLEKPDLNSTLGDF